MQDLSVPFCLLWVGRQTSGLDDYRFDVGSNARFKGGKNAVWREANDARSMVSGTSEREERHGTPDISLAEGCTAHNPPFGNASVKFIKTECPALPGFVNAPMTTTDLGSKKAFTMEISTLAVNNNNAYWQRLVHERDRNSHFGYAVRN